MTNPAIGTVAITGVTGYLGGLLRNRLTDDGVHVIGLTQAPMGQTCAATSLTTFRKLICSQMSAC